MDSIFRNVIDDLVKAADAAKRELDVAAGLLDDSPSLGTEEEHEEPAWRLLNVLQDLEFAVAVARTQLSRPEEDVTLYRYGDDEGGSGVIISDRGHTKSVFYMD